MLTIEADSTSSHIHSRTVAVPLHLDGGRNVHRSRHKIPLFAERDRIQAVRTVNHRVCGFIGHHQESGLSEIAEKRHGGGIRDHKSRVITGSEHPAPALRIDGLHGQIHGKNVFATIIHNIIRHSNT